MANGVDWFRAWKSLWAALKRRLKLFLQRTGDFFSHSKRSQREQATDKLKDLKIEVPMAGTTRNLLTEFNCTGKWWLPEDPDHPVFGTLTYEPAGQIRLELMGTMGTREIADRVSRLNSFAKWEVLLGLCEDGTRCTVLDVREISGPLFPSESGRSRLLAERLFMGSHFNSVTDIVFENALVEYTYLEDWVRARTFQVKFENDPPKRVVEFSAEPLRLADIAIEAREIRLALYAGVDAKESVGKSFEARARAWFQMTPNTPRDYRWYEEFVWSLGSLLTLCIGAPVYPRKITGRLSKAVEPSAADSSRVELYVRLQDPNVHAEVSYPSMPVPFFMIADQAGQFVAAWNALQEKINPVIGLLAGTYYNPRMYVETEFLTLMQAFEILHRRLFGGTYVTKDEWQPSYQALIKAIPDSLASDHRESLKMRLHYGFEISLRKRLTLALRGLEERTRNLITAGDPRFIEQCVETRNGLTHEGSGSLLTEGLEALWKVNRRLRALVTSLIWKELGLSEDRIVTEIFSRVRP